MARFSLKNIKVIRTDNHLVVMDSKMQDILSTSDAFSPSDTISHTYEGIEFISIPKHGIYVNLNQLQARHLLIT